MSQERRYIHAYINFQYTYWCRKEVSHDSSSPFPLHFLSLTVYTYPDKKFRLILGHWRCLWSNDGVDGWTWYWDWTFWEEGLNVFGQQEVTTAKEQNQHPILDCIVGAHVCPIESLDYEWVQLHSWFLELHSILNSILYIQEHVAEENICNIFFSFLYFSCLELQFS